MPHQRADTLTTTAVPISTTPRASVRHQLTSRGNSDAGNGSSKVRGSGASRVPTRTNKHGVERPEHPLSSLSRAAAEEGGGAAGGDGSSSFALGAASRGGYRRNLSEISSGHRCVVHHILCLLHGRTSGCMNTCDSRQVKILVSLAYFTFVVHA